jgi:hypothetical protein
MSEICCSRPAAGCEVCELPMPTAQHFNAKDDSSLGTFRARRHIALVVQSHPLQTHFA